MKSKSRKHYPATLIAASFILSGAFALGSQAVYAADHGSGSETQHGSGGHAGKGQGGYQGGKSIDHALSG